MDNTRPEGNRVGEGASTNTNTRAETKFFNATEIQPPEYYESQKRTTKIKEQRANIDGQITSIVNHVYTELIGQRRKSSLRKASTFKTKKTDSSKAKVEEKEVQTRLTTIDVPNPQRSFSNLPRIKALCGRKTQERNFRTISPNIRQHYDQQARMREVLRERAILESMLMEHKKLQRDRESIVHEIQMMRNYLDDIRGRLDTSLNKLNIKHERMSPEMRNFRMKNYNK